MTGSLRQLDELCTPNMVNHWLARTRPAGLDGVEVPEGPYAREVAFIYRLADGRIAERWAVRDDLGMMGQLGAVQPA